MAETGRRNREIRYDGQRALQLLRAGVGEADALFREGQEDAIRHVVERPGRSLVVERTGWGKSFVYFIAAKLLREAGNGPAVLVSPLLALMRNQIDAAVRMGVAAETINSGNTIQWPDIVSRILKDEIDILLIAPERLANERFREEVLAEIGERVTLLVVDEAHCISDWGHDFRPDYRRIERLVSLFPPNLRILATTATANGRVIADLEETLGPNLRVQRGNLDRPSLGLQTIHMPSKAKRMAWIAERLGEIDGTGIIYALTIRDARQLAEWLQWNGINARAYTGTMQGEERVSLEQALLRNEVKVLVATTALGMGYDKPDVKFVIHYQTPQSVVHYYQQVGRAGRALDQAYGVLLGGSEDLSIQNYFVESAFPTPGEVHLLLHALESARGGHSFGELEGKVNIRRNRLEQTLKILGLESPAPIVREGATWYRTAAPLEESFWERIERITALRRSEQIEMQRYLNLTTGHMEFLLAALGGETMAIEPRATLPLREDVEPQHIQLAVDYLADFAYEIEARKRWPSGQGSISPDRQANPGRTLAQWGDEGVGEQIRLEKYEVGEFSDQLVDKAVELIRQWEPQPRPQWLTFIPSHRRPNLVPDLARRLADKLGIPCVAALSRSSPTPEQKTMANSAHQAQNARESLEIVQGAVRSGAVLLVDDMVDSRWTITVAADLLRSSGAGEVFPFALARVGGR